MAVVCLTVLFLFLCSSSTEAKKRLSCTKVDINLCKGLGYKWTTFPNPITQIESQHMTSKLTKLYPQLARFNCTKVDAVPFLCSVYVPKCDPKMPNNVILPCRGFCEEAVGHCPTLVIKFGMQWPEPLNCSRYPVAGDETKCINDSKFTTAKARSNIKKAKGKKNDTCCRQGIKAARRHYQCSLTSSPSTGNPPAAGTSQELAFVKRVLRQCQTTTQEANFKSCCLDEMDKIKKKEEKKKRREERRKTKESQRKLKQKKREEKLIKKNNRKKARKENKKMKKAERKTTSG